MALSWSPEHCAIKPADREQCARKLGFVLHGLWPQYQRGLPSDCKNEAAGSGHGAAVCRALPQPFPLSPRMGEARHLFRPPARLTSISWPATCARRYGFRPVYQSPEEPLRKSSFQLKADLASANEWLAPITLRWPAPMGPLPAEIYVASTKGTDAVPCSGRDAKAQAAPLLWPGRTSCCAKRALTPFYFNQALAA